MAGDPGYGARSPTLAAIIGGILVFHEPIGSGALAIAGRMLAFCLVIGGAALMPREAVREVAGPAVARPCDALHRRAVDPEVE